VIRSPLEVGYSSETAGVILPWPGASECEPLARARRVRVAKQHSYGRGSRPAGRWNPAFPGARVD